MLFDYGYKVTTFFLIYKFFLTFFILFLEYAKIYIYAGCPVFLSFPAVFRVRLCPGPGPGRVSGGILTIIHTRIHARTRTRTGIFR